MEGGERGGGIMMRVFMVTSVDADGSFEDDPEFFDFLENAEIRRGELRKKHPERRYMVFRCVEIETK